MLTSFWGRTNATGGLFPGDRLEEGGERALGREKRRRVLSALVTVTNLWMVAARAAD